MEGKEKYEAGQEPNAPGPDTPPAQKEPQQEPPESILQVHFAGPGLADITSMQTQGHVTLGQLTYLGTFLMGQAFINWVMPPMHEMVKATLTQVLVEAFKPKIEKAPPGMRIPPEMFGHD